MLRVCPSVCLWRWCIVVKRLNWSCWFLTGSLSQRSAIQCNWVHIVLDRVSVCPRKLEIHRSEIFGSLATIQSFKVKSAFMHNRLSGHHWTLVLFLTLYVVTSSIMIPSSWQSTKIHFLSNNNNKYYSTACERSKGCQRSNTLIKLAA